MKTHYSLLGIAPTAPADEVKRAFRREVARYHPDKVQHLGPEFQEIATTRAAELTEAYRVLINAELRRLYDEQLARAGSAPDAAPRHEPVPQAATRPLTPPADGRTADAPETPRHADVPSAITLDVVRRAVMAKLKAAADSLSGVAVQAQGFDAVYQIKGRKPLFRAAEPSVRLAVRLSSRVDPEAVEAAWPAGLRMSSAGETVCLMLLGSGLSPATELAGSVSNLRRRTRGASPLVIPVDVRDWQALVPPDTPGSVRTLLDRLRQTA